MLFIGVLTHFKLTSVSLSIKNTVHLFFFTQFTNVYTFVLLLIMNEIIMNRILLFKDLYLNAFRNIRNQIISYWLKVLAWSCIALMGVVSYAFIYRLVTGFSF